MFFLRVYGTFEKSQWFHSMVGNATATHSFQTTGWQLANMANALRSLHLWRSSPQIASPASIRLIIISSLKILPSLDYLQSGAIWSYNILQPWLCKIQWNLLLQHVLYSVLFTSRTTMLDLFLTTRHSKQWSCCWIVPKKRFSSLTWLNSAEMSLRVCLWWWSSSSIP